MLSIRKLADFVRGWEPDSPESELLVDETARSWADEIGSVQPGAESDWQVIRSRLQLDPGHATRRESRDLGWLLRPAFALALIAAIIIAGNYLIRRGGETLYRTERGERATVTLPDSSVVTLNHTSSLAVVSIAAEGSRRVTLTGEAFFRVRKEARPFEISTTCGRVRVLGTEFNVIAREDRMEVAVLRGSVSVTGLNAGSDSTATLSAGEISSWRKGEAPAGPSAIPMAGYPGWIDGKLLFYRTALADACSEIEQTFNVTVRINDPRFRSQTLTGEVEGNTVDNVLAALARLTGNTFRHENGVYVLY